MTRLKANSAALLGMVVLACGLVTACGGEMTSQDPSDGERPLAFAAGAQSATCLRPEAGDEEWESWSLEESPYWAKAPSPLCGKLQKGAMRVLQAILVEMYALAPAALGDKRLYVGGLGHPTVRCEYHGGGVNTVDLAYFVRPPQPSSDYHPVIDDRVGPNYGKVDPAVFDLERNVAFWRKLCAAGLFGLVQVDPGIRDYVEEQGIDLGQFCKLNGSVRSDGYNWNHHSHQHLAMFPVNEIHWDYFTCPAVCGDGLKEQGEACDAGSDPLRGNGAPYSTCDASCKLQPKMSAKSCVNSYCVGTNNVVFPVRNRPSNPGDTQQNPYPAYCTGTWWIDTRGSTFDSDCTTGWVRLDHCQRPNGAQFAECPAVSFCGDGTTDAGEQCDSGAQNGQVSLAQLCDEACHRVELRTCINSACSGTNSILTEVANTYTGQSNGGRKFYCKGSWSVSTYWTLYDSTCSTVWKEVF